MNTYIVMPAFNEEKRIVTVIKEIIKNNYKVVVIDDGSRDETLKKLKEVKSDNLFVLSHKINLGKSAAMKTGAEYAFYTRKADAVIFMDSDGQHSVSDIPFFLEKLETKKYDVVFGSRNLNLGVPFVRYMGNKIASLMVSFLFGIYVSDLVSGFRALTKKGYEKAKWEPSKPPGYGVETEMIIRAKKSGLSYCEIPVKTIYFDEYKGVSILDAFGVFFNLFYWKFKI